MPKVPPKTRHNRKVAKIDSKSIHFSLLIEIRETLCTKIKVIRCQFHQRFLREFFVWIFDAKPSVTRENEVRMKNLYIKFWWNWLQKTTTEAESKMLRNLFFRQQITVLNLNTTKSRRLAISWILTSVGHPKRSKNKTWFFHAKIKAKNESTFFIGNTGFYLHSQQKKLEFGNSNTIN